MAQKKLTLDNIQSVIQIELEPFREFVTEQKVLNQKLSQSLYTPDGKTDRISIIEANQNKGAGRRDLLVVLGGGTLGYIIKTVAEIFTKKGF